MKFAGYDMHMLSLRVEHAIHGSPLLDVQIAHLFDRVTIEPGQKTLKPRLISSKPRSPTGRGTASRTDARHQRYLDEEAGQAMCGAVSETDRSHYAQP